MMAKKNRKNQDLIEKLMEECSANDQFIENLEEKISSFEETRQLINDLETMNDKAQSVMKRNNFLYLFCFF